MWSYISVVLSPPWAKLFVERSSSGPLTVNLSMLSSFPHDIVVSNIARIADLTISQDDQRPFAFQSLSAPAPVLNSFSINNYVSYGGQKLVLPNLIFDGDAPRLTDLRIGPDVLISSELLVLRTLKSLEIHTTDIYILIPILECCSQLEILTLRSLELTVPQHPIRPRQLPIISLPRLQSLVVDARDVDDAEILLRCTHDDALTNLAVFIISPRIIPHRIQALLPLLASRMRGQKKLTGPLRSLWVFLYSHWSSSDYITRYVQFTGWTDPGRDVLLVSDPHEYINLDLSARPRFCFSSGCELDVESTDHFSLACSLLKQSPLSDVQTLTVHIDIHDIAISGREPLHVPQSRWFEMFHSLVSTETLRLKYECFEPFPRPPIEIIHAATPTLGDDLHLASADIDGLDASAPRYLFPHLKKLIIQNGIRKSIRLGARLLIDLQLLLETRRDAGTPIEELELEGFRAWSGITSSPLLNLTRVIWDGEVLSSMWDCEEGWLDLLN
ncbi:hypothetical protein EW146_g6472 [Bondarzewia mesenterica]|uniref:F-box domain-containing protein n=1 Tax=Bondarzewia mesenterica TaxID=1095465 RepID=A0A4S4LNJ9_9AGAM|nr:hypothetical protein EW146_g6472 [Bondarzewia mesenterica]